jgi:hypothetical protein
MRSLAGGFGRFVSWSLIVMGLGGEGFDRKIDGEVMVKVEGE